MKEEHTNILTSLPSLLNGEQESLSAVSEQNLQIEQLGKRTSEILQNNELWQGLSENSRIVCCSRYKDTNMKNRILEVYFK